MFNPTRIIRRGSPSPINRPLLRARIALYGVQAACRARRRGTACTTSKKATLARLLASGRLVERPLSVGLPSSTPAFQLAIMWGVHPDIPGFHYYDKRAGEDRYFPRPGVASLVEEQHAKGRRGIMRGGAAYGCIFGGEATDNLWTLAGLLAPTRAGWAILRAPLSAVLLAWDFCDIPLSIRGVSVGLRVSFVKRNVAAMLGFGAGLALLTLVLPCSVLFVLPAGVAGGARLVARIERAEAAKGSA